MPEAQKIPCLVCGFRTITSRDSFEVCPVCFWEEEGDIKASHVPTGGPNGNLSLDQARINYGKYGAVEEKFMRSVRPPSIDEKV